MSSPPIVSVWTQLETHRKILRRHAWVTGTASVLLGLSAVVPLLFPRGAFAPGVRAVVGLASAVLVVASVLATRAARARLADTELLAANSTQYVRDMKARAEHDHSARTEYVAYLRDSREHLLRLPEKLERRGIITEQGIAPALAAIDAEIAFYEKALGPEGSVTQAR